MYISQLDYRSVKPDPTQLLYVAESEAVAKWESICTHLGVPRSVVVQAQQTYPLNTEDAPANRFHSALMYWYRGDCTTTDGRPVPVTCEVLCKALEECRYHRISEELKKSK